MSSVERAVGGEHVGDIAEGVLVRRQPRIGRDVDAPARDMLAVVRLRGVSRSTWITPGAGGS